MPIYAYRCGACGHSRDVLQKLSDPLLTTCPVCAAEAFSKQVTAAGFQLKGSGWYVTDFRDNGSGRKPAAEGQGSDAGADKAGDKAGDKGDSKSAEKAADKPADKAATATAAAPAPAASAPAASTGSASSASTGA